MTLTWKRFSIADLLLLALMLLAAGLASAMRPTISLADERPPINLKTMVPTAFGDWREMPNMSAAIVDPTQREILDKIYSETLTRTYVNREGYRIMLSIAYGKNQSDALQLHKPEVCYPAQGFALIAKHSTNLNLTGKSIAATRLQTSLGQRFEPITYWTVVGDHITTGGIDKKLTEMRYAMRNRIPDGLLVRVSSIDVNPDNAYGQHDGFARQMIAAIAPDYRVRFGGATVADSRANQAP